MHLTTDELYNALKNLIGPVPLKMYDIALGLGMIKTGESVPSKYGARVRVQLGKLRTDGLIVSEGERATTTHCMSPKAKAAATRAATKAAKGKPTAPKKKKAKK